MTGEAVQTEAPIHHFFSDLIEREVIDAEGQPVGDLVDLAFAPDHYPRATHLILRRGLFRRSYAAVPWARLETFSLNFNLDMKRDEIVFADTRPAFDFTLVHDILDKQVVDTNGQKVIRVNDVRLMQVGNDLRLQQVDVGLRGIVRRLGWQWWVDPFVEVFLARTQYFNDRLIQWNFIQPLAINAQKGKLKLTVDHRQFSVIPHADFRDLFLNMDLPARIAMFKSIPDDLRPRIFSEIDLELQREMLDHLDLKEAAELLARVPADQTTDLLEELPKSVANSLLALMETTTARRLSMLLGYETDSAGGLMTTEMLTTPASSTVAEVLDRLKTFQDIETFYHVYLVDAEARLVGLVPLRRLLLAAPGDAVSSYAQPRVRYVKAKDTLREVAFVMEKYRMPAVPVVDNGKDRKLQGIITVDDILAKLIPLAWRRTTRRSAPPSAETS